MENMKDVPQREKYWHEMDTDQKLQKLGMAVSNLWRRVKDLERENEKLKNHTHQSDKLMVPIDFKPQPEFEGYNYHPLNMSDKV